MSYNPYRSRNYGGGYSNNGYRQRHYYSDYNESSYNSSYRDQYDRNGSYSGSKGRHYNSGTSRNAPPPSSSAYSSDSSSRTYANSSSSGPAKIPVGPKSLTIDGSTNGDLPTAGTQKHNIPPTNAISGTDATTGVNPNDSNFTQLLLHQDLSKQIEFSGEIDSKRNYKVIYDPELDKSLSKAERKTKQKKIRFNGESLSSHDVTDPRKSSTGSTSAYFLKPNKKSKKFPFKQLPQPKFIYDKDSLGPPPQNEIVVWDLPSTTSEVYLSNFFKSYGDSIKDLKFINDPLNAVPLGIATCKFQGNPDKSMRIAKKFIANVRINHTKIDGAELKIALNDNDNKLLDDKIKVAQDKLRISRIKIEEEEKKRLKKQQAIEDQKRRETEKAAKEKKLQESANSSHESRFKPNTTTLSIRHHNEVIPGVFLPRELRKYIRDRPYIFINDKYVPTRKVSSQDIKKVLNKYDWTRVLPDRSGFFVVFNSIKECERCFINEDGRKFFEYKMFMELALPENFNESSSSTSNNDNTDLSASNRKQNDVVEEASNMLIKEFQNFLAKDIRERVIAPVVLDLLSHDKYPKLVEELKAKELATKKAASPIVTNAVRQVKSKPNVLSSLAIKSKPQAILPSFRKKKDLPNAGLNSANKAKKNVIPMQHALNYDHESDESDEDDSTRSTTPLTPTLKRERSPTVSSVSNDNDIEDKLEDIQKPSKKKQKKTKLHQSFLYDSASDEDMEAVSEEKEVEKDESEGEEDIDYSHIDKIYQPTEDYPRPVYEEVPRFPSDPLDLDALQSIIKDDEDITLLQTALADVTSESNIKNMEYWAWKQKDIKAKAGVQEISEDLEVIGPLDSRFDSKSGAFKSEGYRKIPDADKIEYLPHRRKIHKPIKTIQHDDDELNANNSTTNNNSNNIQSSRVNRANNRRFAADISAQKQMLGSETDILNLNALTKRKKPVSFARSAIHNWGLYALEPIAAKEMIIEYVGESIRQQVAEHRERSYLKTGIGSSYLFRIDENTVVDATKKGGIARFINHCCNPSCTAKIIKVEGKKRIVIYALRDIEANEELTYDYKFEKETNDAERIRCLCGAPGCKGYLN
ncbi:DEHA2F20834p [Debaryomyces hansenii CBS767]|uniref:Histone-lysine N-methyltransferase, H3 lysine-4 specific n=1 Tax=Debaryomyces hansenii (strain ATCC 36239 / CBS 767 / BCRC 21394 / JCM 1990 / NBRC 0083 / IGC 2968) TaxID=284592 RepID=SET1_DEBHA|nr:DEHA2F20834p [Debaryomyces hansenii CBS767]Q6BKL7.2 RecName: Full=Histone-lysine N-methyltransferase, H3 lysine-4 specific; AltName: Full=COMPASS component SET1; AltName: Full=SET domain-containing protein 1 [Debaryomyces hansenii CBS767]CAG89643.2 DEHA2F20834p [Debaryomyces hansenii CBS767]|eukprot:XP_461254.2 DEHA2F20834p [Debaryomyces hansenii CBS767]